MSQIEDTIKKLLEESTVTAAQLTLPGATNPQDPMQVGSTDPMGMDFINNIEQLELDRPGVTGAENIQQVQFPGQTQAEPMPIGPGFEELDPYDPSAQISDDVAKENYPMGSGADDVPMPQDPNADAQPDQFSAGIQPAQHPAPMVAESTNNSKPYSVHTTKKIDAKAEGKIVVLDAEVLDQVEKKLGLGKGALSSGKSKYSQSFVLKGKDNRLHTIYAQGNKARIRPYGHNNTVSTEELKKHLNESVGDTQPQEPQAAPEQNPVDQKNEVLDQAVAAVKAGNPIDDVAKATGIDVKELQGALDAAVPTTSPTASATTAPVSEGTTQPTIDANISESDLQSDVDALLGEETLSEEFKQKAGSLFEAAVIARVNNEAQRLEEAYKAQVEEQKTQLQEQYATAVETFAEQQASRLNTYINYLGEQWIKQNKVAVESGIKAELTEGFMNGLQQLFTEHYINVPQEKYDLVAEQTETIKKLEESVAQMQSSMQALNESNKSLQRDSVIARLSNGLTDTEAAKLHTLCEGIEFGEEALFEEKVSLVKGNFFKRAITQSPEQLLESTIQTAPQQEDAPTAKPDTKITSYVQALNRFKPM